MMTPILHYIRNWDAISSNRVHEFVANSHTVEQRINTYYGRKSTVIYPPVDIESFSRVDNSQIGDYYLMVGELVRYKRPEVAVNAFNQANKRLIVIGGGEMLSELRALAGEAVSILGPQPFDVLKKCYARCRGLVFPGKKTLG